jgi:hypothetical protein
MMDDNYNVAFELSLFASNIKKKVCGVSDSFLSFPKKYDERKIHIMFFLMLNSQFMNFRLMSSFVGCEQGISTIFQLLKCMIENPYILCF